MAIAVDIFWVMIGILYILYKALKEYPSETVTGILIFLILFGGMAAFCLTFSWLLETSLVLAIIFVAVFTGVALYFFVKVIKKDDQEKRQAAENYERAMSEARKTMTPEDYVKGAARYCTCCRASMDKNSPCYWKNEPYFTKITRLVEYERWLELKKEGKAE